MKLLNKRAVALLIAALMLTMTACSGGGASTASTEAPASDSAASESASAPAGDAPAASGGEAKLQLWHIHTQETRNVPIADGIKRFEAANPGTTVEVTILENDPYKTKLKTVMGSGDAPDVFHSWGGGWLKAFADEGLVMDITEEIAGWKDQLNAEAVGMNTFDGKVWGSPYVNSSTLLYYNKDIFAQYSLEVPTTYEELMTVSQTLKDNGVIPFALGNKSKWPGAQHFVLLSMRLGGADIFQQAIDGKITFEDPSFIKAGQMIQDMVDKGYFPDGVNGINYDTGGSRMMFYTGQCAMIVQTSGLISTCKFEDEDFYNEKLGVALYPSVEGGVGKSTDILAGENAFSISATSKNPEIAIKLLEFMSTDQQLQEDMVNGGSMVSKLGVEAPNSPLLTQAMAQISGATFLQNFIDQTLSPEMSEKHKDTCQALFGKTMTPEEAAAEMQKLFDSTK